MKNPESLLLIPLLVDTETALVPIPTQELTAQQTRQLEQTVDRYLQIHKLSRSYDNVQKTRGVIRSCIEDGLQTIKEGTRIEPADNLLTSFEIGLKHRQSTITATQQLLKTLPGSGTQQGILALPEALITPCRSLMSRVPFTTSLEPCRQLTELAAIRRPVYRDLLSFTRQQVEEAIPGSTALELQPEQEAGLVRNLLFAWAVFQRPLPLLETEDFMLNGSEYQRELEEKGKNLWQELATLAGIDSAEAKLYLQQLGQQVGELLRLVPQGATADPHKIDLAFRNLTPNFLIVNPFLKLTEISENPEDPESIWDRNHAQTLTIGEVAYLVPRASTLILASYRKDPKRKYQLQQAALLTGKLVQDLEAQDTNQEIPALQTKIEAQQEAVKKLSDEIKSEQLPSDILLSKKEIAAYAQTQREIIKDELDLFSDIRSFIPEQLKTAYELLKKYQDGSCITDSRELPLFMELYTTPSYVSRTVLHFLRERTAARLRNFQSLHSNPTMEILLARGDHKGHMDKHYVQALQTTVIDVLQHRSDFLLNSFIKPWPDLENLPSNKFPLLWHGIADEMHEEVLSQLIRHCHAFSKRKYVTNNMERLLKESSEPVRNLYREWEELAEKLKTGQNPEASDTPQMFYNRLIHRWKEKRARNISYALTSWQSSYRYRKEPEEEDEKETEETALPSYRRTQLPYLLVNQPFAPALLLLRTISRLSPLPLQPSNLQDLAQLTKLPNLERQRNPSEDKEGRKIVLPTLRGNLEERGIIFDDTVILEALSDYVVSMTWDNARSLALFYHLEPDIKSWLRGILAKTNEQLKQGRQILRADPVEIISAAEKQISASQSKLEGLKRAQQHALSSRVRQLQALGVILPE